MPDHSAVRSSNGTTQIITIQELVSFLLNLSIMVKQSKLSKNANRSCWKHSA